MDDFVALQTKIAKTTRLQCLVNAVNIMHLRNALQRNAKECPIRLAKMTENIALTGKRRDIARNHMSGSWKSIARNRAEFVEFKA